MTGILSSLLDIAILVFAVTSMFSVGSSYTVGQIVGPLRNVRGVILTLVANFVLVPLLAYAVVQLLALDRSLEIGLLLVAMAAGAPFLIKLTQFANGDMAFSATLLVLLLPVTVVYMPIVVPLAVPDATVDADAIAAPLLTTMLLPLGIGLAVKAQFPRWAERLQPIMSKVASAALLVVVVITVLLNLRAIADLFGTGAILAALLVIGGAFAIGYAIGSPHRRRVVGLATAQRNIAAATVVATQSFDDPQTLVMVVVTAIVAMLILFPAAWALGKRTSKVAGSRVRPTSPSREPAAATATVRASRRLDMNATNTESTETRRRGGDPMRPNFVFILADDLGYADLGCYGCREPSSPNLDSLATQGLLFTNGYANSSVCSPTRFALATGRWQHRLRGGADEPIARVSPELGLPPEHPTLASLLRDAGYATALVGKWHLGHLPYFGPLKSGYEEFFGFLGGAVDYFSHSSWGGHDLYEGEEEVYRSGYLTDLLTERAVSYLRKQKKDRPFLLSLHYNATHWPWETRDDEEESRRIDNIAHVDGGSLTTYFTMLRQMDEGIGQVLDALEETGAADNTLVVFTSDNGGERFSDVWPLRGKKMDLLEGGIRVPYIVRWPARLPAGQTTSRLAITMDWVATFLAAAGVSPHPDYPLDGIDLLGEEKERDLFWRMTYRDQKAVRSGNWKYLSIEGNEFLYDLARDTHERADMKHREPQRFEELRSAYAEWDASLPPIPEDARFDLVYTPETMALSAG